jgi:octaprenyl-diphosphate synthase
MMQPPLLGQDRERKIHPAPRSTLFDLVAAELKRTEDILRSELRSRYPFVNALVDHISGYQGKRLRPALLLLVAKAVGQIRPEHLVLAAVIEMIHTATLVHDDVLDRAAVRRHKATVNAEWGIESSVLLGDFLFTHSFHLAAGLDSTLACRLIGRTTNRVCEGELHQIHHRGNFDLNEQEYFEIIDGKTADLCAVSCRLGAHFAGVPAALEMSLERYGRNLGMAFQVADDLLDLVGDEHAAGKSLGTDVEQGKLTLPLIWVLAHAAPPVARTVQAILTDTKNHRRDRLLPILEECDALGYARRQAAQFAQAARAELDHLDESPAKAALVELSEFVVRRSA